MTLLRDAGERLERTVALDRAAIPAHRAVDAVLPRGRVKDILHGTWLGHPLHPVLTDLPIGFWTSAVVLDLVGGRRARGAADALVAFGVASALPTAAAGAADWSELDRPERRTGWVHAVANLAATVLFGLSFVARRRDRRGRGVVLGLAGAAAASVGGYLGGHLSYRRGAGVNHAASAPTSLDWTEIDIDGGLDEDTPTLVRLDDVELAAVGGPGGPAALFDRCSHLGGPLHEGDLDGGCIRCPWHGSTFRIADGAVMRGPATATQPAYEMRVDGGRAFARRRP